MANYTAADVKRLREQTGAGMMDCKKALEEADGDFDAAVEGCASRAPRTWASGPSGPRRNGLVTAVLDGTERA